MTDIFVRRNVTKHNNQVGSSKYLLQARHGETRIWFSWIFFFGMLVCLSAASLYLDWPTIIKCVFILTTSIDGFFLFLMIMLAFDKNAFK